MKTYIVGGAVRDLLTGRTPADLDLLVTGVDEAGLLAALPGAIPVGRNTKAYIYHGMEFALPRGPEGSTTPVEDDVALRDFTVNALALGEDGELIGHPQSLADLRARILRPCTDHALADDPLRVFRAARFIASWPEFSPAPELADQLRTAVPSLAGVAAERVAKELRRLLVAPHATRGLELLARTGGLAHWLAELDALRGVPAGPPKYHDKDGFGHTLDVLERVQPFAPTLPDGTTLETAAWMALCHDLGKATTPRKYWPRHHGHDRSGESLARRMALRLGLPNRLIRAGELAARDHMLGARYAELRPSTRLDLLGRVCGGCLCEGDENDGRNLFAPFFALVAADSGSHEPARLAASDLQALEGVSLPPDQRNLGKKSGELLRQLRIQALKNASP